MLLHYKRRPLEFILVLADEGHFCFNARCDPCVVWLVVEAVHGLTVGVLLRLVGLEAVEERVGPLVEKFGSVSPEVAVAFGIARELGKTHPDFVSATTGVAEPVVLEFVMLHVLGDEQVTWAWAGRAVASGCDCGAELATEGVSFIVG